MYQEQRARRVEACDSPLVVGGEILALSFSGVAVALPL